MAEFNLKSGNATPFKLMGSSPAKHGTTSDFHYGKNGHNPDIMDNKHEDFHAKQAEMEKGTPKPSGKFTEGVKKQAKKIVGDKTPRKNSPAKASSPFQHKAFGSPHPINPQGVEQQPGAGHPNTARAHNVRVPKPKSPVKHNTEVRMSDPPQYPKHRHEGSGSNKKTIKTGGWTTDAGAQHTGGATKERITKALEDAPIAAPKKESPAKMHKPGHAGPAPKTISRKEELLNQGFTQKDADLMIKSGAVTGKVGGKVTGKAAKPAYIKTIQNKKKKGGKLTKAEKRQLDEYRIHVTEQ